VLQAIPERYSKHKLPEFDEYFAMGRGLQKPKGEKGDEAGVDVPSLVKLQGPEDAASRGLTIFLGNGEMV
jgi:hypothetical protein